MIVRLAEPTDATQLAALNNNFNADTVTAQQIKDYLIHCPDHEKTVVAELNSTIVGFGCLQVYCSWCYADPWAELTELFIEPDFRRGGIGQTIVHALETLARDAGATEILLLTNKQNVASLSLYRKCGYIQQPRLALHKDLKGDFAG